MANTKKEGAHYAGVIRVVSKNEEFRSEPATPEQWFLTKQYMDEDSGISSLKPGFIETNNVAYIYSSK